MHFSFYLGGSAIAEGEQSCARVMVQRIRKVSLPAAGEVGSELAPEVGRRSVSSGIVSGGEDSQNFTGTAATIYRRGNVVTTRPGLTSEFARPRPAFKPGARRTRDLVIPVPDRMPVFLVSGQLHASTEPCAITTILGSCVAVCIWEPLRGIGGATHYLLPDRVSAEHGSLRFGTLAIEHLISKLLDAGCRRSNLKARVFGGASIFAGFKSIDQHLGTKNCEIAFRVLQEHGIPIVDRETGGSRGRKLIFHTDTGDAWVKLL